MRARLPATAVLSCLAAVWGGCGSPAHDDRASSGPTVHSVQMISGRQRYAFEPAELRVHPGDTVRFVLVGPAPESVAFDTAGLAPEARDFLLARSLLTGPLLVSPGQRYDVAFAGAPPGRYPFHSIPHVRAGMRGTVLVAPASE